MNYFHKILIRIFYPKQEHRIISSTFSYVMGHPWRETQTYVTLIAVLICSNFKAFLGNVVYKDHLNSYQFVLFYI